MLKEEAALRKHINDIRGESRSAPCCSKLITALVRAVREDCAKVAEETPYKLCDGCARHLAREIRRK